MRTKATELHHELRRILLKFPDDGKEFESLIARAIESVLGHRVWSARAGSQFGGDMGTAPSDGPGVKVEAKRHKNGRKLNTRELLGEIAEAIDTCPRLDLWILATCAEVPEQVRAALEREGKRRGIGIGVLDLSSSLHCKLPRLLVEAQATAVRFVRESLGGPAAAQMESLLGLYRGILPPGPAPLLNPACLFDLAAERARALFNEALAHAVVARSRFGQRVHDQTFVARDSATTSLDCWRASDDLPESLVILCGEEGDGKTWAASAWLARFADQHGSMPVFLSSREAFGLGSIEAGVSAFVHGLFPETEEAHWRTRVQRWLSTPAIACRLILVLDGLNEQPTAPWRHLIDTLFVPDHQPSSIFSAPPRARAKLPTIVTCRTGYWNARFPNIPEWRVELVELGPFSIPELRAFLRQHGRRPEDFSPEVWQLLRKPRYSSLVVQHYERLLESSDITVDRLLYEDWKHRWEEKSDFPLDDNTFQRLLRDLADQSLKGTTTHGFRELRQLLPADDGERILTELVTGGVLEEASSGYRVAPARLCHALGLLLLSDLIQVAEEENVAEVLGRYLEPSGLDAHAPILTAAIFGASLTDAPPTVVRLLFRSLFSLQNLGGEIWRRIQAYFPAFPETYRELAEELVADSRLDRSAFQAIESSYYRWCDHDRLSDLIADHAHRWLATIPMQSPLKEQDQTRYEQRLAQLFGDPLRPGRLATECVEFRLVVSPQLGRLHALAFGVLSARSTTVAPEALVRWAIGNSLQQYLPIDSAAWIIRFLAMDKLSDLVAEIEGMLTVDNPIWQEAAYRLAGMLPDGRGGNLQERAAYSPPPNFFERRHAEDPCNTGIYLWRPSDCHACLQRLEIDAGVKATNLAYHANSPTFRLPHGCAQSIRAQLRSLIEDIDPAELHGSQVTGAQLDLKRWAPAFARWIPREFARSSRHHLDLLSRKSITSIEEDTGAVGRLELGSSGLESIAMILGRRDWQRLQKFWEQWVNLPIETRVTKPGGDLDLVEADLFRILLLCADPSESRKLIEARATTAFNDRRLFDALPLGLPPGELRLLWKHLFSDRDQLVSKLFLLSLDAVTLTDTQREQLVEIVLNDARDESQTSVCILALLSQDRELVRMLLDARAGLLFEFVSELYWIPSGAIPANTPFTDLEAISPPLLSHILENRPDAADDLAFAGRLREFASSNDSTLGLRPTPRSWCPFSLPPVRRALAADPQLAGDLLARLKSPGSCSPLDHSYWLYYALCESLLMSSSEVVENLLDNLINYSYRGGKNDVTGPHSVLTLMARHQEHQAVPPRLESCLNQCVTDAALQSFSLSFLPDQDTWLWAQVRRDLNSDRPILLARALTLAGFAHDADRATGILAAQASRTSGWLDCVRRAALARATGDQRARHWFTAFLSRKGRAESWAAFQLFLTCVDRRFDTWLRPSLDEHGLTYRESTRRLQHLRVNHERINKRIEKSEKGLKTRFCHHPIAGGLFPWRSDWKLSSAQIESLITAGDEVA